MESIYETYKRVICSECQNRYNEKDLCHIVKTEDNIARCINYERCMQTKCNQCKFYNVCFEKGV